MKKAEKEKGKISTLFFLDTFSSGISTLINFSFLLVLPFLMLSSVFSSYISFLLVEPPPPQAQEIHFTSDDEQDEKENQGVSKYDSTINFEFHVYFILFSREFLLSSFWLSSFSLTFFNIFLFPLSLTILRIYFYLLKSDF